MKKTIKTTVKHGAIYAPFRKALEALGPDWQRPVDVDNRPEVGTNWNGGGPAYWGRRYVAPAIIAGLFSVLLATASYADNVHTCTGNSCNDSSVNSTTNISNAGGAGGNGGSVTNTNSNSQGQRQRQTQGQGQGQTQNNGQTIAPTQSTSYSEAVQDRTAPATVAPSLTAAGTGVCLGSVSFGLSGPMAGVSAGWTKVDEGCETRSNAALLFNMGMRDAALRLMMTNPKVREAMLGEAPKVSLTPAALEVSSVQGQ